MIPGASTTGKFVDAREQPLDLVGVGGDGVETDHLDRAGGLVDVRARVLERRGVREISAERRERLDAARKRLVDLAVDPRQRAQVEFSCGFSGHGAEGSPIPTSSITP